ncbi:MAG: hypothetical protein JNG90_01680, partial [Planctomycetaceae bacterium]|nr:hypothetical protein [Planctomycetaceae bacterium]
MRSQQRAFWTSRLLLIAVLATWSTICAAQTGGKLGGTGLSNPQAARVIQQRLGNVQAGGAISEETAAQAQAAMMMRYDLNRDGQLSPQETAYALKRRGGGARAGAGASAGTAAAALAQQMNQGANQAFNQAANQVGNLAPNNNAPADDPEAAALEARRNRAAAKKKSAKPSLVERFDKDGDGKLNAAEKAEARQAIA